MISKNVKSMNNQELIQSADHGVSLERDLADGLILHFQEIEWRGLYLQMGYGSMFEFFVKRYKYSETTAYERLSVLRLTKEVPEVSVALSTGEINITNLTLAKSFF